MHATLHWANKNVVHAIYLDSLVDHEDRCQIRGRVFVHNCGVYGTRIGMLGLFVESVDIDKMFMVMND